MFLRIQFVIFLIKLSEPSEALRKNVYTSSNLEMSQKKLTYNAIHLEYSNELYFII